MRAKTIDLHQRKIVPVNRNKRKNVFINGIDDNYPERIELIINNSVTAKMGVKQVVSFIVGQGFANKELNNLVVDKKTGLTAYKLLTVCARSYGYHNACPYHIGYNAVQVPNSLSVLPYKNVRIEKEDDLGNRGKFFYSENWGNSGFSFKKTNDNAKWYYPFNKNKKVVEEQVKSDGVKLDLTTNTHNFRGQVLFSNLEPENVYPLAPIDPAYNDADSEYHSSTHRNNILKNGFTEKQAILCNDEKFDEVVEAITPMIGPDGSNLTVISVDGNMEDMSKALHKVSFGNDVKADRYKYLDDENESKILQSLRIHPALVLGADASLFGDGGGKLREIKLNCSQNFEFIRREITEVFTTVFPENNWDIEPLIKEINNNV